MQPVVVAVLGCDVAGPVYTHSYSDGDGGRASSEESFDCLREESAN